MDAELFGKEEVTGGGVNSLSEGRDGGEGFASGAVCADFPRCRTGRVTASGGISPEMTNVNRGEMLMKLKRVAGIRGEAQ